MPSSATLIVNSVVATGRRMNGSEMLTLLRPAASRPPGPEAAPQWRRRRSPARAHGSSKASLEARKHQVDDRRRVEREELRDQQAAYDGDAERAAQFRPGADAHGQRQRAQQRRHGGHHDRPKAQQACLIDRFFRRQSLEALRRKREVDHHDAVLLHDADQQDDADERNQVEILVEQHQREQCADARRRQRRENRDGVDVALVENAQNNVDRNDRRSDQDRLAPGGGREFRRAADRVRLDRSRKTDAPVASSAAYPAPLRETRRGAC